MGRILIVDDNETLVMELEEFIPTIGYEVTGTADCAKDAIFMAKKCRPDLVLMDIKLRGKRDGIEAANIIKSKMGVDIIFISGFAEEELLDRAKVIEPLAYLYKPFSENQIFATLKMAFHKIKQKNVCKDLFTESTNSYQNFTATEIHISELLKQGKVTKEIGDLLNVSPATVIWHRKNIRKKLNISNTKKCLLQALISDPK